MASRPTYDHDANKWVPQCPYGDVCSGCDAAGECSRAWWYDDEGRVIVTPDDRWHGEEASQCRVLVESLSAWGDPHLWQYRLDLLREAIEHEQPFVDRERRDRQMPLTRAALRPPRSDSENSSAGGREGTG